MGGKGNESTTRLTNGTVPPGVTARWILEAPTSEFGTYINLETTSRSLGSKKNGTEEYQTNQ